MADLSRKHHPESRPHLSYSNAIVWLSVVTYMVLIFHSLRYPPNRVSIINEQAIIIYASIILLTTQVLLYNSIRKKTDTPLRIVFLPIPLIVAWPIIVANNHLTFDYEFSTRLSNIVFCNLIVSAILFFAVLRSRYLLFTGVAAAHLIAIASVVAYSSISSVYINYRTDRLLKKEYAAAEKLRKSHPNAPEYKEDGSFVFHDKPLDIPAHLPDSEVLHYPNGWLKSRLYIYDSAQAIYEREINYYDNGQLASVAFRNKNTLENILINYYKEELINNYSSVFDSNGYRYKRKIFYDYNQEIRDQKLVRILKIKKR